MSLLDRGAVPLPDGRTRFGVWAPSPARLELCLRRPDRIETLPMERDERGVARVEVEHAGPGTEYWYRLDGDRDRPDPVSRELAGGVHGVSRVVDPERFRWTDAGWRGLPMPDLILYELHIGSFTPAGTFDSAIARLPYLLDLGVTALEIMPVAEFPGRRNWGYDGVSLYAPHSGYSGPRRPRRAAAPGGRGPPGGRGRPARCGVQPPWARGELSPGLRALLQRPVSYRLGRKLQPRRPRQRRGSPLSGGQRGVLDRRVPPRRPPARRGRPDRGPESGAPGRGDRCRRGPPGRGGRTADRGRRRDRQQRHTLGAAAGGRRIRTRRALVGRLPPRGARGAHRRAERLLCGLRRGRSRGAGAGAALRPRRRVFALSPSPARTPGRWGAGRPVRGLRAEPRPSG